MDNRMDRLAALRWPKRGYGAVKIYFPPDGKRLIVQNLECLH
jgi:hypothetical protein